MYKDPYGSEVNTRYKATIDGQELFVPVAEDNRRLQNILATWVAGNGNT